LDEDVRILLSLSTIVPSSVGNRDTVTVDFEFVLVTVDVNLVTFTSDGFVVVKFLAGFDEVTNSISDVSTNVVPTLFVVLKFPVDVVVIPLDVFISIDTVVGFCDGNTDVISIVFIANVDVTVVAPLFVRVRTITMIVVTMITKLVLRATPMNKTLFF
jgi:hypothetical protein